MPIVFIHGVRVGEPDYWPGIDAFLRQYVAPEISDDPGGVEFIRAFWGDLASSFAWRGIARPRSQLLGQGAAGTATVPEQAIAAADLEPALSGLPVSPPAPAAPGGLISGQATGDIARPVPRLHN